MPKHAPLIRLIHILHCILLFQTEKQITGCGKTTAYFTSHGHTELVKGSDLNHRSTCDITGQGNLIDSLLPQTLKASCIHSPKPLIKGLGFCLHSAPDKRPPPFWKKRKRGDFPTEFWRKNKMLNIPCRGIMVAALSISNHKGKTRLDHKMLYTGKQWPFNCP